MWSSFGVVAIVIALPAMGFALPATDADKIPSQGLISLRFDERSDEPTYVQTRCRDFVHAMRVYGIMLRNNPFTGDDPKRSEAIDWAMQVDIDESFPLALPNDETNFIQAYFDEFGGVNVREPEPSGAIYTNDKDFCTPLMKFYQPRKK